MIWWVSPKLDQWTCWYVSSKTDNRKLLTGRKLTKLFLGIFFKKWTLVAKNGERVSDKKIFAELNHSLEIHGLSPCGTPRLCHSTNLQKIFKAKYRVPHKTIWILGKVLWQKHALDSRPHAVQEKYWLQSMLIEIFFWFFNFYFNFATPKGNVCAS